jgi:hypothetical protein
MFAVIGAVIFAIALIVDLAKADIGIATGTFLIAGLLCLALHMAGVGAAVRTGRRWRVRR